MESVSRSLWGHMCEMRVVRSQKSPKTTSRSLRGHIFEQTRGGGVTEVTQGW